ncbi:beta-N-acetylhexosaminidase [Cellulomonas sp. URHE0023]|uniref:beta-N-acetylhexosaminidase n=1 Tax=Cellulomonas sp. URHE0023 TaxID=1380354 RepID=UPI0006909CC8|nr:beta-N-acetylhexosaminidase [Cellulomonas sp. URHE0023]
MNPLESLVPRPAHAQVRPGSFVLDQHTSLGLQPRSGLDGVARWLRSELALDLPAVPVADAGIVLGLDRGLSNEAFTVDVSDRRVIVRGGDPAGVFYGLQALRQLLPASAYRRAGAAGAWTIGGCHIEDAPRFGWRGLLLDVARHFLPVHDVLRVIDLAAMHRLNVLHLHLTDDQGWRLEIERYPLLTQVGGWRRESQLGAGPTAQGDGRPHGGWYSRDDVAEIVAYAAQRFVAVVPEIDLPGHVQAAVAAYPTLGAGLDGVTPDVWTRWGISDHVLSLAEPAIRMVEDILDDVVGQFPGAVVALGGDESPKRRWHRDEAADARKAELGITRDADLQNWLLRRLATRLADQGRRTLLWDEVLEGDDVPGAIVASWRGDRGVALGTRRGYDVISCPADSVYLDYRQSDSDDEPVPVGIALGVEDVYEFDPQPPTLPPGGGTVLGAQCQIWTEHVDSARRLDYLLFPRLAAFAEAVWTSGPRDVHEFTQRLGVHGERLRALGVEGRDPSGPRPWQSRPGVPGNPMTRTAMADHLSTIVAGMRTE